MAMYIQHGHAKSDKLDEALESEIAQGVIFGARNEKVANIEKCVESVRERNGLVLFDPQFHLSALTPANDRFLPEYPYYKVGRTASDFIGVKKLASYAKSTLDFEMTLEPDRLLSPTVIFDSFESKWCQNALNLADASLEYHSGLKGAPPLLLSFIIGEQALDSRSELDAFLDQITSWNEMTGTYLVLSREDSSYSQKFNAERLANTLYMNYVLGNINGLEIVDGFSDFCGLLYRAVGSKAFATGWSQGLRQFHKRSFTKQKPGGQLPLLRYTSGPLLNSILLGELQQIFENGEMENVLSDVPYDSVINEANSPEESDWTARISELHHWQTLGAIDGTFGTDTNENLQEIETRIEKAQELYVSLMNEGVVFSPKSRPDHLGPWAEAIDSFREAAAI
jgi:hypothetical protein